MKKLFFAILFMTSLCMFCSENYNNMLCNKCSKLHFTTDIGKCEECGGTTAIGAFELCIDCARTLEKCRACGKNMDF